MAGWGPDEFDSRTPAEINEWMDAWQDLNRDIARERRSRG